MWPYPKIIAHRGGGALAPENTLAAMRCGLSYGFRAVEFDVMLSGDAIPVLLHDARLGRTVAGTGNVFDYTAQELAAMDAGGWFGPAFAGEPVATCEQAQQFCIRNRIWMNVEIKPASGYAEQTGTAVAGLTRRLFAAAIAAHEPGIDDDSLPLFSSFSHEALMAAKHEAPAIPRAYLVNALPHDWQARLAELDAIALHVNHNNLSERQARSVKDAGYGLLCYTVNEPARARELLCWGVDACCTDRIDLIGPDFL